MTAAMCLDRAIEAQLRALEGNQVHLLLYTLSDHRRFAAIVPQKILRLRFPQSNLIILSGRVFHSAYLCALSVAGDTEPWVCISVLFDQSQWIVGLRNRFVHQPSTLSVCLCPQFVSALCRRSK
jgi:hypothetical protein